MPRPERASHHVQSIGELLLEPLEPLVPFAEKIKAGKRTCDKPGQYPRNNPPSVSPPPAPPPTTARVAIRRGVPRVRASSLPACSGSVAIHLHRDSAPWGAARKIP